MQKLKININADVGEMAGQDKALMPYLQSCNIATGGHIGDNQSILATLELAKKNNVKIGAHPSYPDKENFGRVRPEITDEFLKASLEVQLLNFYSIADQNNAEVHHIKPHGALYHDLVNDKNKAELFLSVLDEIDVKTSIYTLKGGFLDTLGQKTHKIYHEGFIDRRYTADLNLVNRKKENALISEPKEVWKQLKSMHFDNTIIVDTGEKMHITAETYCLHGDHPKAVEILKFIHTQLK